MTSFWRRMHCWSPALSMEKADLVERRVKPLLPVIGRKLGPAVPAVMTAAREGAFEIHPDGSVTLGGVTLAPDEIEILATPRPGTAVAHDEGLVVVIDTALTPKLRTEGDVRELERAIQDLRKEAGLAVRDQIEVWISGLSSDVAAHRDRIAADTLAARIALGAPPEGLRQSTVELQSGRVAVSLRRLASDG